MTSAIEGFLARTNRRFDSGAGFYSWRDLRYFLYEYEHEKAVTNKLEKVKWGLFTRGRERQGVHRAYCRKQHQRNGTGETV